MAPPELAADAPVLDVAHPLEVGLGPVVGHEADRAALDRVDRRAGERFHPHVPLVGEIGLDHRVGSVAARNAEAVLLDLLEQPEQFEFGHDAPARLEAVETPEALGHRVVERRGRREDVDQGEPVPLSDGVVVEIVRRGDLDAARAELGAGVVVRDERDLALRQRQPQRPADQPRVAPVARVHRDRHVAEHRLRAGGRDDHVAVAVGERIPQVPERAVFLFLQHLEIGDCGQQHRIPVDQPLAAVDHALVVQADEHFGDRLRQALVHRETVARPRDRCPEPTQLVRDRATGFRLPFPDALDEGLTREVGALPPFRSELTFDHHLRRDPGVVGARLPQRRIAAHPVVARQGVHHRVLERMPHVQRAGHVRRRNDDAVPRTRPGARCGGAARLEPAGALPALVETPLDVLRRVNLVHEFRVRGRWRDYSGRTAAGWPPTWCVVGSAPSRR